MVAKPLAAHIFRGEFPRMDTIEQLCVALGLAGLAGLNLYLTVFVTGMAIRFQWIELASQYEQLRVLGETPVIVIAGVLYALEFFADKVPWVDSLWDSVHTIIRPIGGALIAVKVLGQPEPVFDVIVALLAGSVALATHTAKAGTRLVANGSPEPFSNIALSVGEDAAVVGGLVLIHTHPYLAGAATLLFVAAVVYFAPRLFRVIKARIWLGWKKLKAPADQPFTGELPKRLPADADMLFARVNVPHEEIAWAVPCVSGRAKRIPGSLFGWLVATDRSPGELHFVAKSVFTGVAQTLDLAGYKASHESRFLSENLVLYNSRERKPKFTFVFDRSRRALAIRLVEEIERRLAEVGGGEKPALRDGDDVLVQAGASDSKS
jgi:hypothetical protein